MHFFISQCKAKNISLQCSLAYESVFVCLFGSMFTNFYVKHCNDKIHDILPPRELHYIFHYAANPHNTFPQCC